MKPSAMVVLACAGMLAACASNGDPTAGRPAVWQSRGAVVAERACASCHAVGLLGDSHNPAAPPFRDIRIRYNSISLERDLVKISRQGHFEMPRTAIAEGDAPEIADYIETLRARPRP